jgi:CRISPR-associated protein Cas5d
MPHNYCLEISADLACFTRPEMKVERVSYDVITPSAARAIFEAILWKPAIKWALTKIEILNPIQWISIRRNEVGAICTGPSEKQLAGQSDVGLQLFIEEQRQQRAGLFLRDVKYRIYADLLFDQSKDKESSYAKYTNMFERRASQGQCFNQPYMGCREFSCDFRLIQDLSKEVSPIIESRSLGWMLYDLDFTHPETPTPYFFRAEMESGTIHIPQWGSPEVRG